MSYRAETLAAAKVSGGMPIDCGIDTDSALLPMAALRGGFL